MKKFLFLLLIFLCFSLVARAQDTEKDAVRRVVETYLFSENAEERKQTLYEQARIFKTNPEKNKIVEHPFSKAKKLPKGAKTIISVQKVVSIDIAENAAIVKVESDLSLGENKAPKNFQFVSLLKTGGEWKIVNILMPEVKLAQ